MLTFSGGRCNNVLWIKKADSPGSADTQMEG